VSRPTVLLDACVLYPAPIRDLPMHLAVADVFRARWTDQIHDEWTRGVLKNRPDITPAQVNRTRRVMDKHVEDSLVLGYESLIPTLSLPDPNDRHVLAAAIRSKASVLLTFNLKHFPRARLAPYGIEAQHPDLFLCSQLTLAEASFCSAARQQRQSLRNPPKSPMDFVDILERHGLPQTASRLRSFVHRL
jgi:predicted nucleic acid-binding protein